MKKANFGLGQPPAVAVNTTVVPVGEEVEGAVTVAVVQPVRVTEVWANVSYLLAAGTWFAHTRMCINAGGKKLVSKLKDGFALNERRKDQVPFGYWSQNANCGLGQPVAVAVKVIVEPAVVVGFEGLIVADVQLHDA